MKHVHVVAVAPRTGTTLMMELLVSCFEFDGWPEHEQSILFAPDADLDTFCSKNPGADDLKYARLSLQRNPDLWIIGLVRDPRDIIVSRHNSRPDVYWADLGMLKGRVKTFNSASKHDRFLVVRYEDLVDFPNSVQERLMEEIPFLKKKANFSDFANLAKPSERAEKALGGVRPISDSSVGRWRSELPRLKGQIERYGPIDQLLMDMGYEPGNDWENLLDSIEADPKQSFWEMERGNASARERIRTFIRKRRIQFRFLMGRPYKKRIVKGSN